MATLKEIAQIIDAKLFGEPNTQITGLNTLVDARPGELSFFSNRRYLSSLKETQATAVILDLDASDDCPVAKLVVDNPYLAYARVAIFLDPKPLSIGKVGIHPTAVIAKTADLSPSIHIAAQVVIGERVCIGEGVTVGAGTVIGDDVSIGKGSHIAENVTIYAGVILGECVRLKAGSVIGSDGFGFARDGDKWVKIPQFGTVLISDNVEIGANTTIDRGALSDTFIGAGVKIDNLVQIAHNVSIGEHTAIAGQVAIAGSATIGKRCMIAGGSLINGHIHIADDVFVLGNTGVTKSIRKAGAYAGWTPLSERYEHLKYLARLKKIVRMWPKLKRLTEKNTGEIKK